MDDMTSEEELEVTRQEVYEDYVNCHLQQRTEVQPCRDVGVLKKAAQYLLGKTERGGPFTVFPFYHALTEGCGSLSTDRRRRLSASIKAVELLETICVHLFLQPWKKEIKTLKTFTGPFVYCLLPVFSSSTIQSILASIGYMPHSDTPQSEYRLSEDANPDRAMLVGFELLLARVEYYHLLDTDQLKPQEWLDVLQIMGQPPNLKEPTERETGTGQKYEEEEKEKEGVPTHLNCKPAANPLLNPLHCHHHSEDQSIIEMKMTYPDLAFRGRPLLDKPPRANNSRCCSKTVYTASTYNYSDTSKTADLDTSNYIKVIKPATLNICSKTDDSKTAEAFDDNSRDSNDRNTGQPISDTDGSRVVEDLIYPQAISMHITLRAGSTPGQKMKPTEHQPNAEPPVCTKQETAAGITLGVE